MNKILSGLISALLFTSCSASAEHHSGDQKNANSILLVGNKGEDSLSFIDLKSGREIARRPTGPQPHEIAISPDGRQAAVVSYGGETIDVFDAATQRKLETIDLTPNKRPHGIIWLNDGRIIASTEGSDSVTIVSQPDDGTGKRMISSISTGQKGSHMVVVTPDQNTAFVTNMGSGTVSALDLKTKSKITDMAAGKEPEGLAITPDGKTLWVADRQSDKLHVFDAVNFKKIKSLQTGSFPIRVAVSPDGKTVVTSNLGDGAIEFFEVASLKKTNEIKLSGSRNSGQVTMLFSQNGQRLYVAETGVNKIAEIDMALGKLIGRLSGGTNGDGLGIAQPVFDKIPE